MSLMKISQVVVSVVVLLGFWSTPIYAQSPVEIRTTAPEQPRQFQIIEPGPATRQARRPQKACFSGRALGVHREPAFIEPFVGQTQGGTKYGLSGWTSPSVAVGSL